MGHFLSLVFVFLLGCVFGVLGGGLAGGAGGAVIGACKVIDTAVEGGSLTQDQANALLKAVAADVGVRPDGNRNSGADPNHAPSPCAIAIDAL